MGFKENINDFFGLCNLGACPYRITALGESGAYVEGVLRVLEVSREQIALELKGAKVKILGAGLVIGHYCERDLTIKGRVEKIIWQK